VFGPQYLNGDPLWFPERGLNSLSILSYLSVAEHVTGDPKYGEAFDTLVKKHGYAQNIMYPKMQNGPGSGNQSDDEMAFMDYYGLIKYARDPVVRDMASFSFNSYWLLEQPELNPFFNFAYAGVCLNAAFKGPFMTFNLAPRGAWLEQSIDTLMRIPLDRCDWLQTNSHRKDIVPLPDFVREEGSMGLGCRRNGLVLPVDERHFNHWNCDPWELNQGGNGSALSDGTVFLLPYYMGLYHGFIAE
jgi:hypothetical protein